MDKDVDESPHAEFMDDKEGNAVLGWGVVAAILFTIFVAAISVIIINWK